MQSAKLAENEKADASIFFDFQGVDWKTITIGFQYTVAFFIKSTIKRSIFPFDIRIIIQEIYNG